MPTPANSTTPKPAKPSGTPRRPVAISLTTVRPPSAKNSNQDFKPERSTLGAVHRETRLVRRRMQTCNRGVA